MPKPKCICCHAGLVQDAEQVDGYEDIAKNTRYWYCNHKACIRYRLLVLPELKKET
jgi:hypothetical protein